MTGVQTCALPISLLDQVVELLLDVVEEDRVLVDVLEEVLARGLAVRVELDPPAGVVQVQPGVS